MMRNYVAGVVAFALALFTPSSGWAQATDGTTWLEVRGGWVAPQQDLGRTEVLESTGYVAFAKPDRAPSFGAGVGVGALLSGPWSARAVLDFSTRSDVEGEWFCAPFVACPSVIILVEGRVRHWSLGVDVVYEPTRWLQRLTPVVFAGVGLRGTHVTWGQGTADVVIPTPGYAEINGSVRVGTGLAVALGRAELFGEVSGAANRFGSGTERFIEGEVAGNRPTGVDVGVSLGMRWEL